MLSINGFPQILIENLLTLGKHPGHSVHMSKNTAKRATILLSINIVQGHPLPNADQFKVIDQEKSQVAHKAKEAIQI